MSLCDTTGIQWNQHQPDSVSSGTLRPEQNGWHSEDNIFICIFLKEFCLCIWVRIYHFFPKSPKSVNKSWLVWEMVWHQTGDKPSPKPKPMMTLFKYANMVTRVSPWLSNQMPSKVWVEIIYPFSNFNGSTIEVWEWLSNFIPHFNDECNYLSILGLKWIHASKRGSRPHQRTRVTW